MERRGDWMITFTGKRFWPLDPRTHDVCFADIGAALSMICRYGGHTRRFYSVAEHSTLLTRYFLERQEGGRARFALVHDMAEAYTGDIVRPLKKHWPSAQELECRVSLAIIGALSRSPSMAWSLGDMTAVEEADRRICINEMRAFWTADQIEASGVTFDASPLPHVTPIGVSPAEAERDFRHLFQLLFPEVAYE